MTSKSADWLGLTGKTALVTGGASGIGLSIAKALLGMGASVEIIDRDTDTVRIAADLEGETGGCARAHHADVRDRDSLRRVRDAIEVEGRSVDILIPNAGINVRKPLLEVNADEVDTVVATNLTGVINTMQIFVPMLQGRDGANVVVTSSVSAIHGMNLRVVYAATKAGLSGLVRGAAVEWGPLGLRVNAVAPGVIRTPLTAAYMAAFPEREKAACTEVPLNRVGTPEEVADVVLFLAGRPSRFMTGQTVVVDGGLTAGSNWW